ncbi:MAG: holo-ACP synthase [Elusimicrobiota bacterium]|nr:holo-ACP synthase [Elusimicrobiota bacterium]
MDIGIDIVEVKRIKQLLKYRKFLNRVFSDDEIQYCSSKKNKAEHFAVRFAAKEALWKALRSHQQITHKDISIKNLNSGKPKVILPPRLKKLEKKISVSLSHTKDFACAVAIIT